jgi:Flp pilus assembly pilin Flp
MTELYFYLRGLVERENGQTMAEYAVVLAVITIGVIGAIGFLGDAITARLGEVQSTIAG